MWKIHAYGVWVACVKSSPRRPYVLLADHVKRGDMIMIYRVENLKSAAKELGARGWQYERSLEIPPGPCFVFHDPGQNTVAIYQNVRPKVMKEFNGRIDEKDSLT